MSFEAKTITALKDSPSNKNAITPCQCPSRALAAVFFNPDLLDCIFNFLGFDRADYLSFQFAVDIQIRQACHRNDPLQRMALVCKMWNPTAVKLLYRDLQVYRQESIPLLLRTLRESYNLRPLIRSYLFIPPESSFLVGMNESVHQLHVEIYGICEILSKSVPLHLKLVESASFSLLTTYRNDIRTLHIVPVGGAFSSEGISSLSLPMLETLTLQFGGPQLFDGDNRFLLDAPKLSRLRLLTTFIDTRKSHVNSWFHRILPKIKHLELHNIQVIYGDRTFYTILKQCSETLESILLTPQEIIILGSQEILDLTDFRSLTHLTLQVPPLKGDIPPVALPLSLVHLTIWHRRLEAPVKSIYSDKVFSRWTDVSFTCLQRVSRCLESVDTRRTPNLKSFTLFAWKEAWNSLDDVRKSIENKCRELGVELHTELWEFTPSKG
ncbi:hypothetical protein SCHPADRAFT_399026 [Schizopora paradoxa]|uniref:Uncharacterized protein n=1 Tax=Schizopora paradoxa TaxID=27342 RepID=A0A0H2RLK5_9AGAM|nr:hypothetical protein SCHPADRAFT_399026 [Schizopora paradoxa]